MRSVGQTLAGSAPVRWLQAHTFAADLLFAVALGAMSVGVVLSLDDTFVPESMALPDHWAEWFLVIGSAWAVPFRRLAPVPAVIVGGVLQAGLWVSSLPDTALAVVVLVYTAAAHRSQAARWAGWGVPGALMLFTTFGVFSGDVPAYFIVLVGVLGFSAAALGASARSRQQHMEAAEARADELVRSRQGDRERAIVEERARIARELHDVVAHGLSVIVVQASAAQRILERDPDGTKSALHQIEMTGRNALNEMRQVLSAIRTDPDESWQPAPGLAALDQLVAEMATTGLEVSVTGTGAGRMVTPGQPAPTDAGPLPATVDLTAYRIVQESLTNVLKHGGRGVTATVDISRSPRSLDLLIADNGDGAAAVDQGGHGLRGMQERVEVFGGRFDAAPRDRGGFAVSVSLPLDKKERVEGGTSGISPNDGDSPKDDSLSGDGSTGDTSTGDTPTGDIFEGVTEDLSGGTAGER
ncbi:MAG: sensor histidine kinase [Actinomycetota bacterium]